jgi:hypothetical protein
MIIAGISTIFETLQIWKSFKMGEQLLCNTISGYQAKMNHRNVA